MCQCRSNLQILVGPSSRLWNRADPITDRPLPSHWPAIMTLRELLTEHLDIFSVPRRSFFEFLSYFTTDELETEKLQEFCSAEGQEDLWDYCNRTRRTIFEVLQEFKSAAGDGKIPLDYLLDLFPEIRPRQFSIASSIKVCTLLLD